MSPVASVVFRVDADQENGLGHLRRCLTLADQLRNTGCKVRLVCRDRLGPELASMVASQIVFSLDKDSRIPAGSALADEELWDAEATLSVVGQDEAEISWVVVDSYRLGHRWERRVSDAGLRVMVIDDFRTRKHHADLLVSDSEIPFDPALNGRAHLVRTLVGRQYAMIGPEYAYRRSPDPERSGPRRLLISYGGSDSTGETVKAVKAICVVREHAATRDLVGRTDVVIGPLNPRAIEIEKVARSNHNVAVHIAPPGLAPLMHATDLFLTAGGNSMLEALALRKPCLVTVTGDNQEFMVSQLATEKMIRSLGAQRAVTVEHVAGKIVDILSGYEEFAAHVASRQLFDHLGTQRIAGAMLNWRAIATP